MAAMSCTLDSSRRSWSAGPAGPSSATFLLWACGQGRRKELGDAGCSRVAGGCARKATACNSGSCCARAAVRSHCAACHSCVSCPVHASAAARPHLQAGQQRLYQGLRVLQLLAQLVGHELAAEGGRQGGRGVGRGRIPPQSIRCQQQATCCAAQTLRSNSSNPSLPLMCRQPHCSLRRPSCTRTGSAGRWSQRWTARH